MKVLIIRMCPWEIPHGDLAYNVQELGLAAALRKRGIEADVMCAADNGKRAEHRIGLDGASFTLYCERAFRKIKNNALFLGGDGLLRRYDILMGEEYNSLYVWHLAKAFPERLVVYHGPYYHPFNRRYNAMARAFDAFCLQRYRKQDTLFLTKSGLARDYLAGKGLRNVRAVGVGLSPAMLSGGGAEEEESRVGNGREPAGAVAGGGYKLLYVGVLEPRRNSLFLLDILKWLNDRGEDVKLVLVGRFRDAGYRSRFEERVERYGLGESIRHVEHATQRQLKPIYEGTDLFLFPTLYDIYGMVLLEAMFFGKPVLSTPNGGSEMMIENGRNGFVIDAFSAETWGRCILDLKNNPRLAERVGFEARRTIAERFTWDALAGEFIDAFQSRLSGSPVH